jgi:hypothetical protein
MNVVMISPGFPHQMPYFTMGLAKVGARVYGVGDQPLAAVDEGVKRAMTGYLQVRNLWDEEETAAEIRQWVRGKSIDRVECLWEPGVVLAGRVREALGVPGLTAEQSVPLRDKVAMKDVIERAGLRTPKHARARTANECRAAAERIGYPLIIKPIAGAGSADTYELRAPKDLENALKILQHVAEASIEEFIEGEEHTFDTVCANGEILFENVGWYRPKPLIARLNEWVSPQTLCLRDIDRPELQPGRKLGREVIRALGFRDGFTHMEWFRTPKGEAVFGEIGGRPPGGQMVHGMNYATDADLFVGWAEAVTRGRIGQDLRKKYDVGLIFKRAQGPGSRVVRYDGMDRVRAEAGPHIAHMELTPIGAPKKDWRQVVQGDGWIVVRHPDRERMMQLADLVATHLTLVAG